MHHDHTVCHIYGSLSKASRLRPCKAHSGQCDRVPEPHRHGCGRTHARDIPPRNCQPILDLEAHHTVRVRACNNSVFDVDRTGSSTQRKRRRRDVGGHRRARGRVGRRGGHRPVVTLLAARSGPCSRGRSRAGRECGGCGERDAPTACSGGVPLRAAARHDPVRIAQRFALANGLLPLQACFLRHLADPPCKSVCGPSVHKRLDFRQPGAVLDRSERCR
eukprot:6131485-Prymnesium_polylepis.1